MDIDSFTLRARNDRSITMILIKNIGELVGIVPAGVLRKQGAEMAETGVLREAWLAIEDGKIAGFGQMADLTVASTGSATVIDAQGGMVLPAFCDSHTHIVYAGSRDGDPPTCCTRRPKTSSTSSRWPASAR